MNPVRTELIAAAEAFKRRWRSRIQEGGQHADGEHRLARDGLGRPRAAKERSETERGGRRSSRSLRSR